MCQALHIPLHYLLCAYNYVVYIKVLVYAARNQLLFEKYQTRQNTMPIYANKILFIFALCKNRLFLYESKMWVRLSKKSGSKLMISLRLNEYTIYYC